MQNSLKSYFILNIESEVDIVNILKKRMDVYYNNPNNENFYKELSDNNMLCGFKNEPLSSISSISIGRTPKDRETGLTIKYVIPLVKTSNVHRGEIIDIDEENSTYISENELGESNSILYNDVLLTVVGANLDIVGRAALNKSRENLCINQNIARIRCVSDEILPEYIMIYLNSMYGQNQIRRISKQGNQVNMNAKEVGDILVIIPSLDIQKRVVDKYIAYHTDVKENKNLVNDGYNYIYNILYDKLKLVDQHNSECNVIIDAIDSRRWDYNFYNPVYNSYIKFLANNSYKYEVMSIKEISTAVYRGDSPNQYTDDGVKLLQVKNVDPFKILLDDVKYISDEEYSRKPRFQLKINDVLVSGIGPPLGEACVVTKESMKIAAYNHITIIRVKEELINPLFLCTFLNSKFGQMQMKKYYTGVRQIYLTNECIEKLVVPVPPLKVQLEIAAKVNSKLKEIKNAENKLNDIEGSIFDLSINELMY